MTVTEFTGGALPAGWTAQAPVGSSIDLPGSHLQLTIQPGQTFNSLSGSINAPQGPLVWQPIAGAFDLAVGLAEEPQNLPTQGLDLLALDNAMNGIRLGTFCGAQTGPFRNDIGWFIRDHPANTTHLNTTGDAPMSGLYGGPGWLRLAWDGATTYTCYASHTGRSGSWHTLAQFTSTHIPTRFALAAVAFPSGVDGRVQRIQRIVDLLARGTDDATTDPPADLERSTLHLTDFGSGTLPGWLTPQSANGGTVAATTSGVELAITAGQLRSQAWLLGPAGLPPDHGLLLTYQLAAAGYTNAFWVPALAVATATDLAGARTPDDKYGPGTSLIMEMPAREHAAGGQLLRLFRRSPIRVGETQSGSREFDGYTLAIEDLAAPVSTVGLPLTWLRLERVGPRMRVRAWLDVDPEPAAWLYEVEDHMRFGDQVAITLSQNDSVVGAGTAAVRLTRIEVYQLEEPPPPPAVATPGVLTAAGSAPQLIPAGARPTVAAASTRPALTAA